MSSMDIPEFLTACVAEDEQYALRSHPGPWVTDLDDALDENVTDERGQIVAWVRARPFTDATRSHIARHDPARVLREVAAKRQLLEWCTEATRHVDWTTIGQDGSLLHDPNPRATFTTVLAMKTMAAPYADRPGYKEEWKL